MSHIFISLNQIKSLRPTGSGQARCPSFLELSCPSMESGVEVGTENWGRNQTFSAQSPIFTIILSASRHGCAAGAGTLVGPWRGLPLVPTITPLLRASSFKGYSPSHPMEGHSSWAEHSSPQIVDPTKKTHLLISKNLRHSSDQTLSSTQRLAIIYPQSWTFQTSYALVSVDPKSNTNIYI